MVSDLELYAGTALNVKSIQDTEDEGKVTENSCQSAYLNSRSGKARSKTHCFAIFKWAIIYQYFASTTPANLFNLAIFVFLVIPENFPSNLQRERENNAFPWKPL